MSENFESGLHDLYTRAASAHAGTTGFPTTAMVGTARRNRRVRAAGVSIMTVAAVVGVGFAGVAAVRTFGDGGPVVPAETPTVEPSPTTALAATELTCGLALADLPGFYPGQSLEVVLDAETIAAEDGLSASVTLAAVNPPAPQMEPDTLTGMQYAAVQNGVVVGVGKSTVDDASTQELSGRQGFTTTAAIDFTACEGEGLLQPGTYDLYGTYPAFFAGDASDVDTILGGGPWPFTVTDAEPTPDAMPLLAPEDHFPTSNHSALLPDDGSVPDGDYFGFLQSIDAAAGTVDVDLAVFYTGQAAIDYLSANAPNEENPPPNDYYVANDTEQVQTLQLAPDVQIWDWCTGTDLAYAQRSLAEWAAAPTVGTNECGSGAALARSTTYWLDVRNGVVAQVIGQYTP